jgi:hypothetical protein
MHIDVAINQLECLISYFKNYRETRFTIAMISSKEIATKMEIEHTFREKRIIRRKKQFDENANDKIVQSAEESFRIDYFLYIVDQAISSIQSRFEQFQIYKNNFSFLFNFKKLKSLDDDDLQNKCLNLEGFLKHDIDYNLDGLYLFSEFKVLKEILQIEESVPIDILNYIKRLVVVPNLVLTIARTVVRIAFAQVPRSNHREPCIALNELTLSLG